MAADLLPKFGPFRTPPIVGTELGEPCSGDPGLLRSRLAVGRIALDGRRSSLSPPRKAAHGCYEPRARRRRDPRAGRARSHGRVLAGCELFVGRSDLLEGQRVAAGAVAARARQAAVAR